jgi:hypothetical protein
MKHLKVFGALTLVALAGAGSASLIDVYASVSGTADVEPALSFQEVYYNSNVSDQSSGEYILVENRLDSVNISEWSLNSDGHSVDLDQGIIYSESVLLLDNSTGEASVEIPPSLNYRVLVVGNLADQGLSPSENLSLVYQPEQDTVASISYDNPGCGNHQSFIPAQNECGTATAEITGVNTD